MAYSEWAWPVLPVSTSSLVGVAYAFCWLGPRCPSLASPLSKPVPALMDTDLSLRPPPRPFPLKTVSVSHRTRTSCPATVRAEGGRVCEEREEGAGP